MVIKVKEITIGRNRKWAWDFGNAVGYNIGITVEGTTVKDTVPDMIKRALVEIMAMEIGERERCRNEHDIADLQNQIEFKEKVDKPIRISSPGFGDYKDKVEKSVVKGSGTLGKINDASVADSKALPEIKNVNPITEEVTMDLKGVTGMAQTPKAILVTKMGLQKWIPLSCLILEEDTLKADGTYYDELKLLKGKSWILDKPWDKLEVRKS